MTKPTPVDIEVHLREKRNELIWALTAQNYFPAQIARVFNMHRATIGNIIKSKPMDWKPKWHKVQE